MKDTGRNRVSMGLDRVYTRFACHSLLSHPPVLLLSRLMTACLSVGNVNGVVGGTRSIDTAAQHAANKGRGISGGSGGGGGNIISSGGSGGGNLNRGRSSPVYLPESLSQAIYVPTQKITTLHPGVGAAAVAVATALAGTAAYSAAAEGGDEEAGAGEDDADVRLCSPALSASPALLQSVTGEVLFWRDVAALCRGGWVALRCA